MDSTAVRSGLLMKNRDLKLVKRLADGLTDCEVEAGALPGIATDRRRYVFLRQLVDSVRRVRYMSVIRKRQLSLRRADPIDPLFDPLKAAIINKDRGDIDEAFWCVFLFIHFGKHRVGSYRYAKEVYGRRGGPGRWDWVTVSSNCAAFSTWADGNHEAIRATAVPGGFGNHRKYESLSQLGVVVQSYVKWVDPPRTHASLIANAIADAEDDGEQAFDKLYHSMARVARFGRTARFDYLAMLGKIGLASIAPGSAYLEGSTGPYVGATLLLSDGKQAAPNRRTADAALVRLDDYLKVGMQVIEDALCNWQKSPDKYQRFRG